MTRSTNGAEPARVVLLALFAALALIATACGGSGDSTDVASTSGDTEETADAGGSAEGSLVASTVTGGQIDFASLEGQDVVLWFWAPW